MSKLLLVDDDQDLSELLCEYLNGEGLEVDTAFDGPAGLEKALSTPYDLIILDIMLPHLSGIEVLKSLRQQGISLPVLMLTAKGDDLDRILGLELGADDYVPKPCNPRELLARIKAILRRSQPVQSSPHVGGDIHIDASRLEAKFKDTELTLTGAEFKVLHCLHEHLGTIVSKEALCLAALGRELTRYDRSIDVHVSNLRKKLTQAGAHSDLIANQRGNGYILKPL